MALKIWKPTCPSCGGGLDIREGQLYVQCENCGSSLIIEGWETKPKPPAKVPPEDYNSWPTGVTIYPGTEGNLDMMLNDDGYFIGFNHH